MTNVKNGKYVGKKVVNGSLDLMGCTGLTSLPDGISCKKLYADGRLSGHDFVVVDSIPGIVKSRRFAGEVEILSMVTTAFDKGNLIGSETFYVVRHKDKASHGKTIRQAMRDLRFKLSKKDPLIDLTEGRYGSKAFKSFFNVI